MGVINYISPDEFASGKGVGPEDNSRYPKFAAKQQGFLAIAFGFALGLTLIVLFLLLQIPYLPDSITGILPVFWGNILYTIGVYFISGLVIGSVLSVIYNLLLHKRFDLFGIDHVMD